MAGLYPNTWREETLPHVASGAASVFATACLTWTVHLRAGILGGLAVLALLRLLSAGKASVRIRALEASDFPAAQRKRLARAGAIHVAETRGALLFMSAPQLDRILADRPPWPAYLLIDLRQATTIDSTALATLRRVVECLEARGGHVALVCASQSAVTITLAKSGLLAHSLGGKAHLSVAEVLTAIAEAQPRVTSLSAYVTRTTSRKRNDDGVPVPRLDR